MKSVLLALALAIPIAAHAANCNSVITADEASVLLDEHGINQAASKLVNQGIDPHVITLVSSNEYDGNLRGAMTHFTQLCPSWIEKGAYKPNLLVLFVSTRDSKKNAFFGETLAGPFPDHDSVNFLYSQVANPYFHGGRDYPGGFAAALNGFADKNAAYHDQKQHPVVQQKVENNQAVDLHGFWVFLGWLLAAVIIGLIIWFVYKLFSSRTEQKENEKAAQGNAIDARTRAEDVYNGITTPTDLQTKAFLTLSNNVKNDPTTDGLSVLEYNRIESAWNDLRYALLPPKQKQATTDNEYPEPLPQHFSRRDTPESSYYPPTPIQQNTTTVIREEHYHDSDSGFASGVLVGDMIGERESRRESDYDRPSYRSSPEPRNDSGDDSSYSASSSSDDDNNSGDDSSYDNSCDPSSNDSGDDSSF